MTDLTVHLTLEQAECVLRLATRTHDAERRAFDARVAAADGRLGSDLRAHRAGFDRQARALARFRDQLAEEEAAGVDLSTGGVAVAAMRKAAR